MAMTDTHEATAEPTQVSPTAATRPEGGLAGLLGTGDNRTIGRLWISFSLVMLAVSGVTGALVGAERLDVGSVDMLDEPETLLQLFSLHSIGGVFLFLLPLIIGVATIVVPAQVGAPTVAFPRAAAGAFWMWLLSTGLLLASYAIDGGPFGGDSDGVVLFVLSFGAVLASLCVATICVVATVLALRTTGMTLDRVPLFSWSMLIAGVVWLLSLPVLAGFLVLLYVDLRYSGEVFGGAEGMYANVRWVFGQPQVYAAAIPALGFIGDTVPVIAKVRSRLHPVFMVAIALFGVLGLGAWTFNRINTPELVEQVLYIAMAFAVLLPLLAVAGAAADTMRRGSFSVASPMLFSLAALLMLLAGAAAGAAGAIEEIEVLGTTWDTAQVHYVLGAAAIAGIGALYLWAPLVVDRPLREAGGRLVALLLLAGTVVLCIPDLVSGALDQPAGPLLAQGVRDNVETLNAVSLVGGGLMILGVLVFAADFVSALASRRRGNDGERDPWAGFTLEWAEPGATVPVTSPTPVLDAREPEGAA